MSKTDFRAVALLSFLVVATAFPFLNRPYFVDDYFHVSLAKGILSHPWKPYDAEGSDAAKRQKAWEIGQQPDMLNPPLFHFFLAAVIRWIGGGFLVLRTAALV